MHSCYARTHGGLPYAGRRRNARWLWHVFARLCDGLRGRLAAYESGDGRGFLLELLWKQHIWDYADSDATGDWAVVLERAQRSRLAAHVGWCVVCAGGGDCKSAHLLPACEPVQYDGDA